jgi:pre-rRNA-processing protein TSR4
MIDLGFAEKCEKWQLRNTFFPSKIGGFPSWLELKNIPEQHEILCELCNEPCAFLCQIYAPSEVDPVKGFHRTIFLFVCKNGKCCQENVSK